MISQLLAQNSILVVALAMVAAGGVFYAVAYPLLSGEAKMEKRKAAISERKRVGRAADRSADPNARRKQIADKQGVPPYVIFHDRTLRLMAEEQPTTETQMRKVSGVGDRKYQLYGDEFIDVILRFLQEVGVR